MLSCLLGHLIFNADAGRLLRFSAILPSDSARPGVARGRAVDGAGGRMCIALERDAEAVASAEGGAASLMGLGVSSMWWPRGQCSLDIL